MCFAFLYTFLWNISHSTNNSARYHKCQNVFMSSTRYSCRILTKLGFARQFFAKSSNITFHEKPSSCGKVVPCEQTDRHEVTSLFAVLRTRPTAAEIKQPHELGFIYLMNSVHVASEMNQHVTCPRQNLTKFYFNVVLYHARDVTQQQRWPPETQLSPVQ